MKRIGLSVVFAALIEGFVPLAGRCADVVLPGEPAVTPALAPDPFPDRMSAFVWRNWFCVPVERMAKVVGATPADLSGIAAEMGLPPQPAILPEWRRKGYITVVRRNWHLLDYDQLTELIDMTRAEFAVALKEDDFLFHKLGSMKPKVEPLRWSEGMREEGRGKREEIARILAEERINEFTEEPRFQFVKDISQTSQTFQTSQTSQPFNFRMIASYFADYGDPLGDPEIGSFPEGLLQKLAAEGVNAVWMHVVLNTLVKDPKYPEFGIGSETRIANLKRLVGRAARYGIKVYLYMNEPRCLRSEFFDGAGRDGIRGVTEDGKGITAMCTSVPETRRWLRDSLATLFSQVKGLGGVFTITMSENLTSCASHNHREGCPRCKARSVGEIVAEVNATIVEGVTAGDQDAEVIVWNWAWPAGLEDEVFPRLPKRNCRVMSSSERDMPVTVGGKTVGVRDYSISQVGPGEVALRYWDAAKRNGLPVVAKVQACSSWELSPFPYIPVLDLVDEHARKLSAAGVNGVMLSWSCGSAPAMNLRPFGGESLDGIARSEYGEKAVPKVRKAWTAFSEGFRQYPFDVVTLYKGPQHWGPANPLYPRKTGYSATMVGFPYDDLCYSGAIGKWDMQWCGRFPVEPWIERFEKVRDGFEEGCRLFAEALGDMDGAQRAAAARDLEMFRAEALHFRSVVDQSRFVLARDRGDEMGMRAFAARELEAARRLLPIVRADSRIGYECSNHYFYIPQDIREKIVGCVLFLRECRPWVSDEEKRTTSRGHRGIDFIEGSPETDAVRFWLDDAKTKSVDINYDESKAGELGKDYTLPDPLVFADGRKVETAADWAARRREILGIFERELYGRMPPKPEALEVELVSDELSEDRFSRRRIYRTWFRAGRSGPYVDWFAVIPTHAKGKAPVFLHLNYKGIDVVAKGKTNHYILPLEMLVANGYAYMSACYKQITADPSKPEDYREVYDGVYELWGERDPKRTDNTGTLMAWAWGLCRGLDLAERIPEIDATRNVMIGSSRLGKAALLAGAYDERVAVTVPNQTGAVGVQIMRRNYGETLEAQKLMFPHWYCSAAWKYIGHPERQPFDQHMLLACVAPRALLLECYHKRWFDPKGEFIAAQAASPVWEFLGEKGLRCKEGMPPAYDECAAEPPFGFVRRTECHGLSPFDWKWAMDFADKVFKKGSR